LREPSPEELEVVDLEEGDLIEDPDAGATTGDDEFAAAIDEDRELPAYRPLGQRPGRRKRPAKNAGDESGAPRPRLEAKLPKPGAPARGSKAP